MTEQSKTYVFIDESGDAGFRVDKGSSPYLCMAAIICCGRNSIATTEQAVADLRTRMSIKKDYEFHFCEESPKRRRLFCDAVANCPFTVRAIVIDKSRIYEWAQLRKSSTCFYNYTAKLLLKYSFGFIENARVVIDGDIKKELKTYLRKELNGENKIIHSTKFGDSKYDTMLQVADMTVGSIAHSYKMGSKDCKDFRKILRGRIVNVWEFGNRIQPCQIVK